MRVALVTPWFGAELIGGAERLAWDSSQALSQTGAGVDVLTTCCRSFHDDWSANYHRPGVTEAGAVTISRFRVDPRDRVAFSRANSALLALRRDELRHDRAPLPASTTDAFISQGIRSSALLRELRERGSEFDAFLFLPYLYGTTVEGLSLVAERAFLVPCLHDEAYAYLDRIREMFRSARGLLFNSEGELNVAASLYGPWIHGRSSVIGHAVDVAAPAADVTVRGFVPQRSRYLLFLGRGDRTKNIDLALEAFARFRAERRTTSLQLIVAGPHARPVTGVDGVTDLGAVTEEGKAALLAHARALVQPSTNESFSRTVYEAWHLRRPVVVHADCVATAELVEASGGGWTARSVDEWSRVFATIDESSDSIIDGVGMRGRAVALRSGSWDDVARRALDAINKSLAKPKPGSINRIVSLDQRSAPRSAEPRFDDGAVNVLSLAVLETADDAAGLAEIFALLLQKTGRARLFLFDESCMPLAREMLERIASEIGIRDALVILGDDVDARFAALRDSHVACVFGAPLDRPERIEQAMWFDIPIVAFNDPLALEIVEPFGISCGREDVVAAAILLFLAATEPALRANMISELRNRRRESKASGGQSESGSFRTARERHGE